MNANRQNNEGFTQVPHEILESLARADLSSYQHRVLTVIIRLTLGWHKEADTIANLQFCNATGIKDRRNVHRTIQGLEARKIIVVCRDDNSAPSYRINKNLAEWQLSSIKTTRAETRSRRTNVVDKDDKLSSVETTQGPSVEMSGPSSRKTPSEDIRKEIKERKDNSRSRANFFNSDSRTEDSESKPAATKPSLMAQYLDWKAKNGEDIIYSKWISKYA
jgi:phage replication O-like protein O